jgi:hypothetical protein
MDRVGELGSRNMVQYLPKVFTLKEYNCFWIDFPRTRMWHHSKFLATMSKTEGKSVIHRKHQKFSDKPDCYHKGEGICTGKQKLGRCTGSYSEA